MRISDWSSDVCSSDLKAHGAAADGPHRFPRLHTVYERAKHGFNTRFEHASAGYAGSVAKVVERKWLFLGIYALALALRSEEHTSELQSLMRISYAVFCLKKKKTHTQNTKDLQTQ